MDLRTAINAALLRLLSSSDVLSLQQRWFRTVDAIAPDITNEVADEFNLYLCLPALALVSLYVGSQVLCTGYHARRLKLDQVGARVTNMAEKVTGIDLDRDGDVAVNNRPRMQAPLSRAIRRASAAERWRQAPMEGAHSRAQERSRVAPEGWAHRPVLLAAHPAAAAYPAAACDRQVAQHAAGLQSGTHPQQTDGCGVTPRAVATTLDHRAERPARSAPVLP